MIASGIQLRLNMIMARLSTTTGAAKYNVNVLDLLSRSMSKDVAIVAGKGRYVLANTLANKNQAKTYIKLVTAGRIPQAMGLLFDSKDKRVMTIGAIDKAQLKGVGAAGTPKGNKGDVGEGILAAAIVARFTNKNSSVTPAMVVSVIKKLAKSPNISVSRSIKKIIKIDSPNKNPKIIDQVECTCVLAEINTAALFDKDAHKTYAEIFKASSTYVNSGIIKSWSQLLFNNNQKNFIQVQALGTEDQAGTKVDIGVRVDGEKTDVNISLKVGDVKQFGQVGGSEFEKMVEMFGPLGINLASIEDQYTKLLSKKKINGALHLAYSTAATQIDAMNKTAPLRKKFINKFGDFIRFHATRHEENVSLVQLGDRDVHVYSFGPFQEAFCSLNIQATVVDSQGKPTIRLHSDGRLMISLRARIENKPKGVYVRNLVEKGPLFTELLSQHF